MPFATEGLRGRLWMSCEHREQQAAQKAVVDQACNGLANQTCAQTSPNSFLCYGKQPANPEVINDTAKLFTAKLI